MLLKRGFLFLMAFTLYVAEVGEPLNDRRRWTAACASSSPTAPKAICCCARSSARFITTLPRGGWHPTREGNSPSAASLRPMMSKAARSTSYAPLSDHPYVAQHRDIIHKLGVTGGSVEARIANAENEANLPSGKVEVVATYKLAGVNRSRMENLFHRLFAPARLNITINDRFGHPSSRGMVSRSAVRHRRGRRAYQGWQHYRLHLRSTGCKAGEGG